MKKLICLLLTLLLVMNTVNVFAMGYEQHFDNEATFETLEEARVNGPEYLSEKTGRVYVADPALDSYPAGTTYVYRSAGIYSALSAGTRMNTTILVYTDKSFGDKDAALGYIKELGLDKLADEATGSVTLVTPIDPNAGFGLNDQYAFYQLQSAMCNVGFSTRTADGSIYYADNAYYGGLTYRYLVGIDGGATFINNYIASTFDYITRIAGLLLINGSMDRIYQVAGAVPTSLVNAPDEVVEKYKAANGTNAMGMVGDTRVYYNQQLPLQKVYATETESVDAAGMIKAAYYGLFIKALRNASLKANLYTASTPYANYKWNMAPYSLSRRNAIIDGRTQDGLVVRECFSDQFNMFQTEAGEYVDLWYEVLPEEVLDGTAPDGTIPLVLACHGAGDDPIQFLDEMNWLNIAGDERLAIAAPYHTVSFGVNGYNILCDVLPALVEYLLDTYPALDASRVYVTGYSMGGGASNRAICAAPQLFAAAAPQAALAYEATEEQAAQFAEYDIPVLLCTSTYDSYIVGDQKLNDKSQNVLFDYQGMLNQYLAFNEMDQLDYDFETYRFFGAKADLYDEYTLNGEYTSRLWMLCNAAGVPMVGLSVTDFLPHGLYQEYGSVAWNFMKHYARNQETGEVVYNPYVK